MIPKQTKFLPYIFVIVFGAMVGMTISRMNVAKQDRIASMMATERSKPVPQENFPTNPKSRAAQLAKTEIFSHPPTPKLDVDSYLSLKEVGDTAKFSGYTLVKIDARKGDDNPEMLRLADWWAQDSALFLSEKLGLFQSQIDRYSQANDNAFAEYDRKTKTILESAKKIYGPDIALILDGELEAEYNQSWKTYEKALSELLGERGKSDFADFKKRFYSIALDRVGFVPSFIR